MSGRSPEYPTKIKDKKAPKSRRKTSGRLDLNQRPHGPEPCALPAALRPVILLLQQLRRKLLPSRAALYKPRRAKNIGEPRIELGTSRTPSERYTTKPLPDLTL